MGQVGYLGGWLTNKNSKQINAYSIFRRKKYETHNDFDNV